MTDSGLKAYEGETITFRLEGEADIHRRALR